MERRLAEDTARRSTIQIPKDFPDFRHHLLWKALSRANQPGDERARIELFDGGPDFMSRFLRTLRQDDAGQDTTEYVLLVALIALAVTAGMTILASNINSAFSAAGGELQTQTGGPPP